MSGNLDQDPSRIHVVNLLDRVDCEDFVARSNASDSWVSAVSHGACDRPRAGEDYWNAALLPEESNPELFVPIKTKIARRLDHFLQPAHAPRFRLSRLAAARYLPGGHVANHADASPGFCPHRRHSFVCYINDEYEGGMTAFEVSGKQYRGDVGQSLLFPSYYVHRGEPVTFGMKYVLVFFLEDPKLSPPDF